MHYKHSNKSKFRKVLKYTFRAILFLVLIGALAVFGYIFVTVQDAAPIDPSKIYEDISKNSYIYDSDGNIISTLHFGEDREIVSIGEVPDNLRNAFIAIEDKTFYRHHGINYKRMAGAVWSYIKGEGDISGTSTITQQLARNVYLPETKSERTIKRKITEIYYAKKIEDSLTKSQILEAYLNVIYLGCGSYGVGTAAETYFSKDISELDLTECAALAALPQAPDSYALITDEGEEEIRGTKLYTNDISRERRNLVLDLMAEQGRISHEEAEQAKKNLIDFINPNLSKKGSEYTYFNDYVIKTVISDLIANGYTEEKATETVYAGGLKIYTTLDSDMQNIIYSEFQNDSNFPWSEEEPEAAMVITEVGTGKILAMMGGRSPQGEKLYNRAINPRQPGSSIKPLSVYSAALQRSCDFAASGNIYPLTNFGTDKQGIKYWGDYITASSIVRDEKMYFNGKVWPLNATRRFTGNQTFRTALQQSINTCAVKIAQQVGIDYSIQTLKSYGITTLVEDADTSDENLASMALGAMTEGVTPLEMSLAYAVFPNEGKRNDPICYTEVTDSEDNVILSSNVREREVIDEGVAFIMTDVLRSVVSKGIAGNASISGVSVGGKTGTTNDNYDIWFDGFTPKYSAALWIGTDHNKEMSGTSSQAAWLWSKIMGQIKDVTDGEYPGQPSKVVYRNGEYYTKGTEAGAQKIEKEKEKKTEIQSDPSMFEKDPSTVF